MKGRVPNRVLDLDELSEPFFARTLEELDALTGREDISYLHPSKRWEYPWALSRARLPDRARVLDAGCGASIFPVYLAKQGYRVSAADLEAPGSLASTHDVNVDYRRADLTALPFADQHFDGIFCISVIEHLGHRGAPAALAELRRVLKPGGRLLLTTDYYRDASAQLTYEGEGGPFAVDWGFYDADALDHYLLSAPGLRLEGDLDLRVDWELTSERMRRFHGYPYTSVGMCFLRIGS